MMVSQIPDASTHSDASAAKDMRYSPLYSYYVLGVFIAALIVAFIDRQIITLLVEPIKADLQINDTQMSLLQGLAFAFFYCLLGLPIGRAADKRNRRNIIFAGVAVWSFFTALCGLSKGYWSMFIARVGVGAGEAALAPSAFSMITDYFPRDKVATAISIFQMGAALGVGCALLFGGMIVEFVNGLEGRDLPLVGIIAPWRLVFILVALPGLVVLMLLAFVKEPVRKVTKTDRGPLSLGEAFEYVNDRRQVMMGHMLGFCLLYMVSYAIMGWLPTYFIRTFGWSIGSVSYFLGIAALTLGAGSTLLGGIVVDRLQSKGMTDGPLRAGILYAGGLLVAGGALFLSSDNVFLAQLSACALIFFGFSYLGFAPAGLQLILPNSLRAQISALFLLLINLIGLGLGPTLVAVFTDYVFGDPLYIKYSLPTVILLIVPLSILLLWRAMAPYRLEYQAAQAA